MRLTRVLLSEYFKRYMDREMYGEMRRRHWRPLQGWKEVKPRAWRYDENRPWTDEAKQLNQPRRSHPKLYVEPVAEMNVFKGDRVELKVGRDKGKQGVINSIIKERNWCFVEGLNCEFRLDKFSAGPPTCNKTEKPLLFTTQVALVDPSDNKPTTVEWRYTEKGDRVRVSTRSGRIVPLPDSAVEGDDFIHPQKFVETKKDTKEKVLKEATFKPVLKTFDQEIMDSMGIKEDRVRAKTYWY